MHPLDGPRLKIRRAKLEIDSLARAEALFWENAECKIVRAELNPKTGKDVYRVSMKGGPPPLDWSVDIGEIAHNLRSALDGLAWQLALLNTKTPASRTQFPVFLTGHSQVVKKPAFFTSKRGNTAKHMIQSLCPKHQAMLERLQPYKRNRRGRASRLYMLQQINNIDKHRLIHVIGVKAGGFSGAIWGDPPNPTGGRKIAILKDGAKFREFSRDMHVNPKFTPLVAFGYGCPEIAGKGVVYTLGRIRDHVSSIIESFAPEFRKDLTA